MTSTILRYKYVPFNDGSLCIISKGTMKFTSPKEFNDPFDCNPYFNPSEHLKAIQKNKSLMRAAGKAANYSPAEYLQKKGEMLKRLENAIEVGEFGQKAFHNLGICCLSRDPLSTLMWSHYAGMHTGFVVEFEIPTTAELPNDADPFMRSLEVLCPHRVNYSLSRPIIHPSDSSGIKLDKQLLTKSSDWAYEQEERVLDHVRAPGIHRYDRSTILRSVIHGSKIDPRDLEILQKTIDRASSEIGRNITLHAVITDKKEFKLRVSDRPELSNRNFNNEDGI